MSVSFIKRSTALKNRAYMDVVQAALKALETNAAFSKDKLLDDLGYTGIEFNWQIIRDIIQDKLGQDLMPVAAAYFKPRLRNRPASEYIASGHGKKTAGYVIYDERHQPVIKAHLTQQNKMVVGRVHGYANHAGQAIALAQDEFPPEEIAEPLKVRKTPHLVAVETADQEDESDDDIS